MSIIDKWYDYTTKSVNRSTPAGVFSATGSGYAGASPELGNVAEKALLGGLSSNSSGDVLQNFNIGNSGFDWTGLGTTMAGIGSGINAITGLGESIGLWKSPQTKLAEENFKLQKEQYQYQKDLQNKIFEREDNAVKRAAADLQGAGLSKTLAAGSGAGAGAVVSTSAPQKQGMPTDFERHQQIANALQSLQATLSLKHMELQNKYLSEQIKNQVVQNKIANLDEKWYTADKIAGYITSALGIGVRYKSAISRPAKVLDSMEEFYPDSTGGYKRYHSYNYGKL